MKRTEMIHIKKSRQNMIGFLHFSDQLKIEAVMDELYTTNNKSFNSLCDDVLSAYDDKMISNKDASIAFEILKQANDSIRTESHRYDSGKIYEYDKSAGAYVFLKMGSLTEFRKINGYI